MKKLLLILLCLPMIGFGQDFQPAKMKGMLEAHNESRKNLDLPPLVWSNKLAKNALKWANKLKKDSDCLLKHSPNKTRLNIGENLAWNKGYSSTPREVADLWISEKKYFNFEIRICNEISNCGHYSQIIWRDTKMVGCAMVECGDEQVWVCQYEPAGNIFLRGKMMPAY